MAFRSREDSGPWPPEGASPQTPHLVTGHNRGWRLPWLGKEDPGGRGALARSSESRRCCRYLFFRYPPAAQASAGSPASSLSNTRSHSVFPTRQFLPPLQSTNSVLKDFVSGSSRLNAAEGLFTSHFYSCGRIKSQLRTCGWCT